MAPFDDDSTEAKMPEVDAREALKFSKIQANAVPTIAPKVPILEPIPIGTIAELQGGGAPLTVVKDDGELISVAWISASGHAGIMQLPREALNFFA